MKIDFNKKIPSLISILRIILAIIFLFLFLNDELVLSFSIFIIAIFTDGLDGYLARKFNAISFFGAYLDVIADFILIILAFVAFVLKGIYPYWIIFLIIMVFAQFILTSQFKMLVYDPIGKYYGVFLFVCVLITIITPVFIYSFLFNIIVIFTFLSLLSRYIFFILKIKNR
jgi:CDP-diacylglycerol--glycerol-3-phosphate 3-phosphatidyltransferase/cardiolipin synthase